MYRVCKLSDISDNSLNKFVINTKEILVGMRNGKLFACDNSCPHRGASLHKGSYNENNLVCYLHGYEYDICTGKLTKMRSWKQSETWIEQNPAWRESGDLIMYDVVVKSGQVYLKMEPKVNTAP